MRAVVLWRFLAGRDTKHAVPANDPTVRGRYSLCGRAPRMWPGSEPHRGQGWLGDQDRMQRAALRHLHRCRTCTRALRLPLSDRTPHGAIMQPGLFPIAGPPPPRKKPADGITYTRVHNAKRVLCGDCVEAIHLLGMAVAPAPKAALWRRTRAGEPTADLCTAHKDSRVEQGQ